jgi:hypothetical protein
VTRVEYLRTAWEVSFTLEDSSLGVASGLVPFPHEVVLQATSDCDDDLSSDAKIAHTLVSSTTHRVESVKVGASSTLTISFSNGAVIQFSGVVNPIDEVWNVYAPSDSNRRRQWGGGSFVQSYFGELSADPAFIAFGTAA